MKLSDDELMIAYNTLVQVAPTLEADCCLIHKKRHMAGGWLGIVMMRNRCDAVEALEIRVACTTPTMLRPSTNSPRHRER